MAQVVAALTSIPSSHPPNDAETLTHCQNYHTRRLPPSPIYTFLFTDMQIYYAAKGLVVARLTLTPNHLNSSGNLHGSVTSTIVDWAGGLAIAAYDCRQNTGVSVNVDVCFLSSAKEREVVEIEGRVTKFGSNMAFTTIEIHLIQSGTRQRLVATGSHVKFLRAQDS